MPRLPFRGPCPALQQRLLLIAVLLGAIPACGAPAAEPSLTIGVAASLRPAVEKLAQGFDSDITIIAGASGTLAAQLRQGAPMDLFISADQHFTDALAASGILSPDSIAGLARGELVAVTTLPPSPNSALDDAAEFAAEPFIRHVALANPELAPYGAAARQYLRNAGMWDIIASRIVYGENAAQTLQFVAAGSADLGFVPLSLALASGEPKLRRLAPLPPKASADLVVTAGVVSASPQAGLAERFLTYARGEASGEAWERYGYASLNGVEDAKRK